MKKATDSHYAQADSLKAEGKTIREIMEATGLNLSQVERHFWAVEFAENDGFLPQDMTNTAKAAKIAQLRLAGESWGKISVRFREPESRTRKCFKEATGTDSKGMRIGKGGRYVADEPRFYTGTDRAKLGTELDPKVALVAQIPATPDEEAKRNLPKLAKVRASKKA